MTTAATRLARKAKSLGVPKGQLVNFLGGGYVPQEKQLGFHAACRACDEPEGPTEIGFGGARGPGKSHALVGQMALDDCQRVDDLKCLLLRKVGKAVRESFEDLRGKLLWNVPHNYNRAEGILSFPNGSRIILGHFHNESDIDSYLGLEYDVIGVEEATTLSVAKYKAIRTCNRTSKDWRPRIYSTTNPGGVGHYWYKARFVAPYRAKSQANTRFIPSTVYDNAFVNKEYVKTLEDLKGWRREAWLNGSWDIMAGQYFTNIDPDVHFIPSLGVPSYWPYKWLGMDYGWTHPTAIVLLAMDNSGNIYAVDEYREAKLPVARHIANIDAMLARWGLTRENLWTVAGGGDMWQPDKDGTTVAADYEAALPLERANMARIDGAMALLGRFDSNTIFIYDTCQKLVETLLTLEHDPHRPEDVLKVDVDENGDGGDDLYDALRYGVMTMEEARQYTPQVQVLSY